MAKIDGFNANDIEPEAPRGCIPVGEYKCMIVASDMKPTKNLQGEYLELTLRIVEGEYEGGKLWDRLNLVNANEQAVQIARARLSAICRAAKVMTPQDSSELHDIPMVVSVGLEPRKDEGHEGEMSNRIKGYKFSTDGEILDPAEPKTTAKPSATAPTVKLAPGKKNPFAK